MSTSVMWVLGTIIVVLPLVLMAAFHRDHEADSRGRRISRRWQGRSLR